LEEVIVCLVVVCLLVGNMVRAEDNLADGPALEPAVTTYSQARVTEVVAPIQSEEDPNVPALVQSFQRVKVEFLNGAEKSEVKEAIYYPKSGDERQRLKTGEKVYVMKVSSGGYDDYSISDRYRVPAIWWLLAGLVVLILLTAGVKGLGSILGLLFSFGVIMKLIVPWIMSGANPVVACATGALIIAALAIYLAHGFNLRTSVAVVATILIIIIAATMDWFDCERRNGRQHPLRYRFHVAAGMPYAFVVSQSAEDAFSPTRGRDVEFGSYYRETERAICRSSGDDFSVRTCTDEVCSEPVHPVRQIVDTDRGPTCLPGRF
jgi:uncharacterized membrane protein